MIIQRPIQKKIEGKLKSGKVLLLLGARRTGKTFLIKQIIKSLNTHRLLLNGEDFQVAAKLENKSISEYKQIVGKNKLLIIDEAQKIKDIGRILKIMIDEIDGLTIMATGSSVFDLSQKLGEPLTGRNINFKVFPIAQYELKDLENPIETQSNLEQRLILGSYPELFSMSGYAEKQEYLIGLVNSFLLKDILELDNIKNASKILNILRLLAFQVGSEVSFSEIGQKVALSRNTVERYIDLLEKTFIIFCLGGFSKNLRKEVSKNSKYYFWDNGIRNAVISNFNPLSLRNDVGQLWENYIISERLKYLAYQTKPANVFFWRTYDQQEIDWVEERAGKLFAFEIKYIKNKVKIPEAWKEAYPESEFSVISKENYLDFIT
ncbi:MAG TPA: ATP-binding protein [Bacteroidales bacterium]|nr:ATP-binding protein [Bacteroidales bacterium]